MKVAHTFCTGAAGLKSQNMIKFAKDPSTDCVCYYNETTGSSKWVSPSIATTLPECPSSFPLPPDWVKTETATGSSKWVSPSIATTLPECPSSFPLPPIQYYVQSYRNTKTGESTHYCLGCKEWGVEFADAGGYCSHCLRYFEIYSRQLIISCPCRSFLPRNVIELQSLQPMSDHLLNDKYFNFLQEGRKEAWSTPGD
ncbi:hypothetical protein FRX31_033496 [Thalictrum thalictroides]|uniref:WW domain-containing protein n=1 Tax=Thalictrum thalictroides TaxID=46969 RepID=A0A7J6UWD8_THATH|nr:hypothetical protein FRX31_033496 [Thalictrum thalictroides]